MLEHLLSPDLEPVVCKEPPQTLVRVGPTTSLREILDAQANTADWLEAEGLTAAHVEPAAAAEVARHAFAAVTTASPPAKQQEALLELKVPEQVRHLVGMLTAYDWEFVNQAKQLRGYVVAKLVEEAEGASRSGDRIKALQALGKVTEIGLFTEKVEVQQTVASDEELDARIKERLAKLRGITNALARPTQISDADPKPDQPDGG